MEEKKNKNSGNGTALGVALGSALGIGILGNPFLYIHKMDLYLATNYSGAWKGGSIAPIFEKVLEALEESNPKKP